MGIFQSKPTWTHSGGISVLEDSGLEDVCVAVLVRVGSVHEREGQQPLERGVAHLLEHALFRGSENYEDGIAECMNKIHASFNASTSRQMTTYHACAPVKDDMPARVVAEKLITPIVDICLRPLLREDDVNTEVGIVKNEIMRKREDAALHSVQHALRSLFGESHPMAKTVGGSVADIQDIMTSGASSVARAFYKRHYTRPRNMHLVVAGPVAASDVIRTLGRDAVHFAAASRVNRPVAASPRHAPDTPPKTRGNKKHTHVAMAWRVPQSKGTAAFDDVCAARVLVCALSGTPMASRLFKRLRKREGMTYGSSGWIEWTTAPRACAMVVHASFDGVNARKGMRLVKRTVKDALTGRNELTSEEIDAAKHHLVGEMSKLKKSASAQCSSAVTMLAMFPGTKMCLTTDQCIERLGRVTARKVRRMARRMASSPCTKGVVHT